MGTSKTAPNAWMGITGSGKATAENVFAGAGGWYLKHPDGRIELLHAMKGVAEVPVNAANIDLVTNPTDGNYSIGAGATLVFYINWSEPVVITGTPQIAFNENAVGAVADYVAGSSTSTRSVFEYDVTAAGDIDTVVTTLSLNSGTIVGADTVVASLALTFTDDTVASVAVSSGGAGYDGTETVTFDAPNTANSTATITTTETGGVIDTVVLEDGGYGYEDGTIAIAGGTAGTVTATTTDGVITGIVLLGAGTGYTAAEGVELAAPTLTVTTATADVTVVAGEVTVITMTEVGYGYDGAEGYTLVAPVGTDAVLTFNADYAQPTGVTVVA